MDEQQLSRLIGQIYAAVCDADEHDQVMGKVAEVTQSRLLMPAMILNGEHSLQGPQRFGDMTSRLMDGIIDYDAGAGAFDPTITFVQKNPTKSFFATDVHLSAAEHAQHQHIKWNRHYIGASHWRLRYEARDGILFGVSAHPRDPYEPHAANEIRWFDLLFEHMARAWRQALRPLDLSCRTEAIATINASGRITATSPAADTIIKAQDGLYLSGAELLPSEVRLQPRWRELIARASRSPYAGERAILLSRPSGKRSLSVIVAPEPRQKGLAAFSSGSIVRIIDLEAATTNLIQRVTDLWCLTPAEARLVQSLVETDCDLRRSADLLGITYSTVRTQLARIYTKTETGGQPELMRLITRISS